MDFDCGWLNLEGVLKIFHCVFKTVLLHKYFAEVEVRFGIAGIDSEGFAKLLYRLVYVAPTRKQKTQVIVRVGIKGINLHGLAIDFNCFF